MFYKNFRKSKKNFFSPNLISLLIIVPNNAYKEVIKFHFDKNKDVCVPEDVLFNMGRMGTAVLP